MSPNYSGYFLKQKHVLLCIFIITFFSCKNSTSRYTASQYPDSTNQSHKRNFDCSSLADKKVIYSIAQSIIGDLQNKNIWNLSEIDTTEFFTVEDYFTNTKTKNRLVYVGGEAGLSSGSAHNLLILFSCEDTMKILWAGQVGDISKADIKDLNNDEIMDIVCRSGTMWMGECHDDYAIFNFKGGTQNTLYEAQSSSVIDCGRYLADKNNNLGDDSINSIFKAGDTLEAKYESVLCQSNNSFYIKQTGTIKIHEGGNTDKDIFERMKVIVDSSIIPIK